MTETTPPVIVVEGLRKVFRAMRRDPGIRAAFRSLVAPRRKQIVAVEDVSFSVQPGEILGYLGPNGAGKSTTIKMLTGVLVPTAGRARVLGLEPYRDRTRNATQIGVVFGQRTEACYPASRSELSDGLLQDDLEEVVGEIRSRVAAQDRLEPPVEGLVDRLAREAKRSNAKADRPHP
jgi:ABC-2 type transport system ATP-binding protein